MHLLVVQRRDRRTGERRTYEVAEIQPQETSREEDFTISMIYKWDSKKDSQVQLNRPKRIFDDIQFHTGMTVKEIEDDLKEKEEILDWMVKNKIEDTEDVGKLITEYYKKPEEVLKKVRGYKESHGK